MERPLNILRVIHKLEHLSLIRIALILKDTPEFRPAFDFHEDDIMLPSDKVFSSMNIPQLLKENLLVYVRYLAVECREWISLHAVYLKGYALDQFPNIRWRWDGRIDRQKTAEAILRAGSASTKHRFRLACGYCFKEDILSLWNEMSEEQREKESQKSLTRQWIQWILHEERDGWPKSSEDPIFRDLLYEPLLNSVGVRRLLEFLPPQERRPCLLEYLNDNGCLVSICTANNIDLHYDLRIDEIFETFCIMALLAYYHWTTQSEFLTLKDQLYPFLEENTFCMFTLLAIVRIRFSCVDEYYVNLFKEFWRGSPAHLKEHCRKIWTDENIFEAVRDWGENMVPLAFQMLEI
ncbi:uncharacterized protein CDAR_20091 [Caerostris darwini]|uniref:F-box domain-containing protein n=1 Tax=Caerostris darwini TaxID=1538125 RepID=A0AAV4PVJ5_9ARAC|nr:uncharacterized protein CDAR_20091 [Caerostris darwini]